MSSVKDDGARGPPEGRKMLLSQYSATNMSDVPLVISIINAHEKMSISRSRSGTD